MQLVEPIGQGFVQCELIDELIWRLRTRSPGRQGRHRRHVERAGHRRDAGSATPTGNCFAIRRMHTLRIVDGLIAEHWALRYDFALALRIGAVEWTEGR